jgi:hypothetical protein
VSQELDLRKSIPLPEPRSAPDDQPGEGSEFEDGEEIVGDGTGLDSDVVDRRQQRDRAGGDGITMLLPRPSRAEQ